ncbi:flagellar assembly protein FliH [Desulfovibrio sp. OttesenSCG-928-I05]|nr:flagellar assembly protein FliH [Desulfovibrio sp. OttesenSCG-928-I05]
MSSSDDEPKREWGNIYMGLNTLTLEAVESERSRNWTSEDEAAYLERVRAKATEKAAGIIAEAKQEAEAIRAAAKEGGYAEGLAEAEAELEEFRAAMADSVSSVLEVIQGQSAAVAATWREELIDLVRIAVEKGIAMTLSEDRSALLAALFTQSVAALENRRNLVIHVNPEDEPAIADIVAVTLNKYPDLKAWSVRPDASINPGGLKVESDDSLVDNRLEKRAAMVDEILATLHLPE